jgi:hypothetical protein
MRTGRFGIHVLELPEDVDLEDVAARYERLATGLDAATTMSATMFEIDVGHGRYFATFRGRSTSSCRARIIFSTSETSKRCSGRSRSS